MEQNDIISAPQLLNVSDAFDKWRSVTNGSLNSFYRFMTTPSVERDGFIEKMKPSLSVLGTILTVTIE